MALVLRDSVFENMTNAQWRAATQSKVQGTWNLHDAFPRDDLNFFVVLSLCAAVFGNRGQAIYAAAGSEPGRTGPLPTPTGLVIEKKDAAGDRAAMEQLLGIREFESNGPMRAVHHPIRNLVHLPRYMNHSDPDPAQPPFNRQSRSWRCLNVLKFETGP
jgi:hypothetical protein